MGNLVKQLLFGCQAAGDSAGAGIGGNGLFNAEAAENAEDRRGGIGPARPTNGRNELVGKCVGLAGPMPPPLRASAPSAPSASKKAVTTGPGDEATHISIG